MGDFDWEGMPDADEEDNEDSEERSSTGRVAVIFLIDCRKTMFIKCEDESDTPFTLALKCVENVTKNKVISNEKDLIGVTLYGTEKSDQDIQNTYILLTLQQPGADNITSLREIIHDGAQKFANDVGHSDTYSLSDALWQCSLQFSKCGVKLMTRRIIFFTNDDDPHRGSAHLQRLVRQKVQDLYGNGIELDLIQLDKPGEKFDVRQFYKDILLQTDDETNSSNKLESLLQRVRRKEYKKHTLGKICLCLPGGVEIAIGIYNMVRPLFKPSPIRLSADTNREVLSLRKTYLEETGEILLPSDIVLHQEYGGQQVIFEKDEITAVKHFFEPGMVLLGFKPVERLKIHHHCKPAAFMFPDENRISGSTCLFLAFLEKCVQRKVVAVCRLVQRRNTPPEFVVLLPQLEESNEMAGFHVIHMPFADDIRALQWDVLTKSETGDKTESLSSEKQIELAKETIKKLRFEFKSENFENPALQNHWRNVEALALDLDAPDEMTDYTLPVVEAMEKRAGKLIEEFKERIFPEGGNCTFSVKSGKRQAAKAEGPNKRSKGVVTDVDIPAQAKAGQLSKLTVDVLKGYCLTAGIKVTGKKKSQLIEDIEKYLNIA